MDISLSSQNITTISLKDSRSLPIQNDSGEIKCKELYLDKSRFDEFVKDLRNSKEPSLVKLLRCFVIKIRTADKKEITLVGRGNLITPREDDVYYISSVDILKKYWSINQDDFCK